MEKNSYVGWAAAGRSVRKGERAMSYLVDPDQIQAVALFTEDQTGPPEALDTTGWVEMTTEDWKAFKDQQQKALKLPKVIVDYNPATKVTFVWCGNNKSAIKALQAHGYTFSMRAHRWARTGKDPLQVAKGWEEAGYQVELSAPLAATVPSI